MAADGRWARFPAWLLAAAVVAAPVPAYATEVYRWVDEAGVVHFSQWRPPSNPADLSTIEVRNETSGVGGDVYPIDELAESIAALRDKMEQDRAERKTAEPATSPPVVYPQPPVAGSLWPYRPPNRPHHPRPPRPSEPSPPPPASYPYRPPGSATEPDENP